MAGVGAGGPKGPMPMPIPGVGPMSPIMGAAGLQGGYSEALRYQPDWFYGDTVVNEGLYTRPRETVLFSTVRPLNELFSNKVELTRAGADISKKRYIYSTLLNSYTEQVRKNYIKFLIINYIEAKKATYGSLRFSLDELDPVEIQKKVTYDLCKVGDPSSITSNPLLMSVDTSLLVLDGRLSENEQYFDAKKELKFIEKFISKAAKKYKNSAWVDNTLGEAKNDIRHYYNHLSKNIYHNMNVYNAFLGDINNQEFDINATPMIEGMLPDSGDEADLKNIAELKQNQEEVNKNDENTTTVISEPTEENEVVQTSTVNTNQQPINTATSSQNSSTPLKDADYISLNEFLNGQVDSSRNSYHSPVKPVKAKNETLEPSVVEPVRKKSNGSVQMEEEFDFWNDLVEDYIKTSQTPSIQNIATVDRKEDTYNKKDTRSSDEELIEMLSNIDDEEVDFTSGKGIRR